MLSGRGKDFYLLTMGSQLSKTTKCWVIGNGIFKGQILSHQEKGGEGRHMYLEPQGDSVTLSAPAFSAPPRGPLSRAHTDAVYPEGCRGDRSPDPSKFAAADRGLPTLRRPGTQKPRGPAAARPVPAPLSGSRGRRALAMLPSHARLRPSRPRLSRAARPPTTRFSPPTGLSCPGAPAAPPPSPAP